MQSTTTQPSNSSKDSTIGEIINFAKFDSHILEHLLICEQYSHRTIKEDEHHAIVDSLLSWLIRNIGCFYITGEYHRPLDLSLYFNSDTLTEEFDPLLLKFRDYLNIVLGIDTKLKYTIHRYKTNSSFIMTTGVPSQNAMTVLTIPELPIEEPEELDILIKEFGDFKKRLSEKVGTTVNIDDMFYSLLNGGELLWKDRLREFLV